VNLLSDGGYYIIEDIETSYWDPTSSLYGYEMGYLNIVDYFTKFNHQVNFKYNGHQNELNIEYIKFASNCIIIKKYDSLEQDKDTDNSGLFDSFNWGNQTRTYKNTMINELITENIYQKFFSVDSGDIVLDIGASLGPFTYSILNKNPKHVYCFEPYNEFFEILVKNTEGKQVTNINAGISNSDGTADNDKLLFNSDVSTQSSMNSITFKKFINDNNLERIDFLKTDCEGGEYEIFNSENFDYIKNNVKKISGEWHLNEDYEPGIKDKFRKFRDLYLKNFDKYEVFSIDGIDIKWDLWNDHFIEYYNEVLIYIDNR
jgi:FkbM family methyltransferase